MTGIPLTAVARLLVLAVGLLLTQALQASGLKAQVDRTTLAVNESLTLTLSYQGQVMDEPDFSVLTADFEIISTQRQSQLALGFGSNQSKTEWILGLAPKRTGDLVIPSFRFKNQVSDAIPVKVTEAPTAPAGDRPIYLETELDQEAVYVQAQAILTVRLHTSVMLSGVDISEPEIPRTIAMKVHEAQYQKTIAGKDYVVVEIKYALFPEQVGELIIPRITVTGMVPERNDPFGSSSFFARGGKPVRLLGEELALQVLPAPDQVTGSWIPAQGLSLSQRWSRTLDNIVVGEPITRAITITAQGLTGAQLPPLEISEGDGYRLYPDQPEISETLSSAGVLGSRSESVALVPTAPGELTLPGIRVSWWDTQSQTVKETALEPVTITVLPAPDSGGGQGAAATAEGLAAGEGGLTPAPSWPLYLSLLGNLLLAVAVAYLVLRTPGGAPPPTPAATPSDAGEQEAFSRVLATDPSQLAELRDRVLHWGRLFWPGSRVNTLGDVAALGNGAELEKLFTQVDNCLYGSGGDSDPGATLDTLKAALRKVREARRRDLAPPPELDTLYPTARP